MSNGWAMLDLADSGHFARKMHGNWKYFALVLKLGLKGAEVSILVELWWVMAELCLIWLMPGILPGVCTGKYFWIDMSTRSWEIHEVMNLQLIWCSHVNWASTFCHLQSHLSLSLAWIKQTFIIGFFNLQSHSKFWSWPQPPEQIFGHAHVQFWLWS